VASVDDCHEGIYRSRRSLGRPDEGLNKIHL
jgi:hypothetical protein